MATTISASTTSNTSYNVLPDTSGSLAFQTGATPTTALTIDASQNATFAGKVTASNLQGPVFDVVLSGNQSISSSTQTLVQFNSKNFDTASAFNATGSTVGTAPAYSFNPQIAGYYLINMGVITEGSNYATIGYGSLYKNGSILRSSGGNFQGGTGTMNITSANLSEIVYMNGSTDYLQVYAYGSYTNCIIVATASQAAGGSYFSGSLVRSA
jgi:hypothetical protein